MNVLPFDKKPSTNLKDTQLHTYTVFYENENTHTKLQEVSKKK